MEQNRFKSPILWGSVVAQIVSILILVGVIDPPFGQTINSIAAIVLQMFAAFGILNNPKDAEKF